MCRSLLGTLGPYGSCPIRESVWIPFCFFGLNRKLSLNPRKVDVSTFRKAETGKPAALAPSLTLRCSVAGSVLPFGFPRGTSNNCARYRSLARSARQNTLFCLFTIKVPPSKSVNLDGEISAFDSARPPKTTPPQKTPH